MKTRRLRRVGTRKIPKSNEGTNWPRGSIVYICGACPMEFGPSDKDLGGSEQAVVQLSRCWAKNGRPVVVYGKVKEGMKDGVDYRNIDELNLADTFDIAIFWRSFGIRLLPLIKARLRLIDLHDSWDPKNYVAPKEILELADYVMVKSKYHRSLYPYIPDPKIKIIMNGVQVSLFEKILAKVPNEKRDPHRFIYASTYERGLEPILKYTWPKIKKAIPDATFHIFYGMNRLARTPLGARLFKLFKQPGVEEHGRVDLEEIAKQKAISGFHLYVSNSPTEIDCISVRESLLCGSIPVLGTDYVFGERDGIHITGSTDNSSTYKKAASVVIGSIKRGSEYLEKKRNEFKKSKTIISWETVSENWAKLF
jgi:glycosyltransferase involved in cell wall biosynthesis